MARTDGLVLDADAEHVPHSNGDGGTLYEVVSMSVDSGYIQISLDAQQTQQACQPSGSSLNSYTPKAPEPPSRLQAVPGGDAVQSVGASVPVVPPNGVPGPPATTGNTTARGFALYVALDETIAAAAGTTFAALAQDVRAYVRALVPTAESHAAVALAPANAPGSDIDVVRAALKDPTVGHHPLPETSASSHAPPARPMGALIDLSRREVYLDGELLNLTYKEFEVLKYLVESASRAVSREELLSRLWRNTDEAPNERTIDVHVRRLRSKLGRLADVVCTVRGQGYRFYDRPEVVVQTALEFALRDTPSRAVPSDEPGMAMAALFVPTRAI